MPVARNAGGALRAVRGYRAERAGDGPTGTGVNINCKHAEAEVKQHSAPPAPPPARATVTRTPAHKNQAPNDARGAREEAQRGTVGRGHLAPECTVRQAAATGGVPANCAVQPSMPYAAASIRYINPTVPETGQLPA